MRFCAIPLAALLLISCQANNAPLSAPTQWVSMNHGLPSHAPVLSLAVTRSGTVYAAAYDRAGVYRSNGGLGGWTPDNRGLPDAPTFSLLLNQDSLLAGTAAGLYLRAASGESWKRLDAIPPVAVYSLTAGAPGILYAATAARGIYSSPDGGKSWARVAGLDNEIILSVLGPDARTIFAGTSGHGLFVTHDGGATWQSLPDFQNTYVPLLTADPRDPRTIYAGIRRALMRSRDDGATWETMGGGLESQVVYSLLVEENQKRIFAGTAAHGIYASDDGGSTWQELVESDPQGGPPRAPVPDGHAVLSFASHGNSIFVGTTDGVIRSGDLGLSWSPSDLLDDEGIGTPKIHDVAINPADGSIYAATEDGLYSADQGTWKRLGAGTLDLPVLSVTIAPTDPQSVYVGTYHKGVFASQDGGVTWSAAQGDLGGRASVAGLAVDPHDPQKVLARVSFERIYKSVDGGDNWHTVWTGMSDETEVETIAIDPGNPLIMYAGGNDELFYSNDGGETWRPRGLEGVATFVVWIDPRASNRLLAGTTDGLYESENDALPWLRVGLAQMTVTALARDVKGNLYAGTKYDGLFVSRDDGKTFAHFGSGLDDASVISLAVDSVHGIIYAATTLGVYRARLS